MSTRPIYQKVYKQPKKVTRYFATELITVFKTGYYAIEITALCRNRKQNLTAIGLPLDDDMRIRINHRNFPKLNGKNGLFNTPAGFNGTDQDNYSKTNIFIAYFKKGQQFPIEFFARRNPLLKEIKLYPLNVRSNTIKFTLNTQAQDSDKRAWYTFTLLDTYLKTVIITATCQKRIIDSDDLKVVIDHKIQYNPKRNWWGKEWYFRGAQLKGQTKTTVFYPETKTKLHYIEIWVDKMPVLNEVLFNIESEIPKEENQPIKLQKRTPTVEDPRWTGDFMDDPAEILMARLIFGEARNQPDEAKIWIAWSVINRTKANSWWPKAIHGVILQAGQYDPFKQKDDNYKYMQNPLIMGTKADKVAWEECYKIASDVIAGRSINPTTATHFHGIGVTKDWFIQYQVPDGKFLRKIGDTYFYWSPY